MWNYDFYEVLTFTLLFPRGHPAFQPSHTFASNIATANKIKEVVFSFYLSALLGVVSGCHVFL